MHAIDSLHGKHRTQEGSYALFQVHQEAILPLLVATFAVGLFVFVLNPEFPLVWRAPVIGLSLMAVSLAAGLVRQRHYYVCAALLVVAWMATGLATWWLFAAPSALVLMGLAVGLAAVFVSVRVALLAAIVATGMIGLVALRPGAPFAPVDWLVVSALIWGTFLLGRQSVRPTEQAVGWFWHSYTQAQRHLELARDRQGELNQAVKDLADARLQSERLNQLLHAARRAAEEAERAKSEFVANVSHELRTPLNLVLGFSEMIVDAPNTYGVALPGRLLADVAAIQRNTEHLSSLINDVLDMSRAEAQRLVLSKEWIEIGDIVESAVAAIRPLFESRGLYLRTQLEPGLPPVSCDRTRIRQVLLNLLGNAGRFTEKGGVTIEATTVDGALRVAVRDTGPGIREAEITRIFEPFRQVDGTLRTKQEGSGLGLHISRRFVELHGGEMGVDSRHGSGSSFWFTLPVEVDAPSASDASRWVSNEWEPRRRSRLTPRIEPMPRIVILEAREHLRSVAERYLEGVEIASAMSIEEARQLLDAGPAQALFIRGETVEQADAWTEALGDTRFATPVVSCAPVIPAIGGDLQVAGYLTKPVTKYALYQAIDALAMDVGCVLLADDNRDSLQLFSRLLTAPERRYRVLQASNGIEALDLLRARRPDLLLLDLVMPGLDGFGVLRHMAQVPDLKSIPVIILSAKDPSDNDVAVQAFQISRAGGLSLPDMLRASLSASQILMVARTLRGREHRGNGDG